MRTRVLCTVLLTFAFAALTASAADAARDGRAGERTARGTAPRVAFVAPHPGRVVRVLRSTGCRVRVRAAGVRRLHVRLDGRLISRHDRGRHARARTASHRRFRCTRSDRPLRPGRHRLAATVVDGAHRRTRTAIWIRTPHPRRAPAPHPEPQPSTPPPAPAPPTAPARPPAPDGPAPNPATRLWFADYSTGDFTQWTWWGQGQDALWGEIAVVDPARVGIPSPTRGDPRHVASMSVTRADVASGGYHAKVFNSWSRGGRPPADVSGTYSSWYYIPRSYTITGDAWANVLQFKERSGGTAVPLWWVQLNSGAWARQLGRSRWVGARPTSDQQPVAVLNFWDNPWRRTVALQTVPLDRWFEIRAELHPNDRIDFFIDGQAFDTASAAEYPVSPFHADGQEWQFGVGNYSTAGDTTLYLGEASYSR